MWATVRQKASNLTSHLSCRIPGIATIKAYNTQKYELELLSEKNNDYTFTQKKAYKIKALFIPSVRMAVMVGFIQSLIMGDFYV